MVFERLIALTERHERLISLIGAGWFACGCAVYAKFIMLPDLPFLTDEVVLYSGAAYNALWFGFGRPAAERHKKLKANPE
ncbi:hypothetical protein [Erythrobacter sp.]|uniref:hypothetical protein n=1 Tax=Erythrobacter sp. TaxID=1042 RepID=UPI0025F98029|nr:hypothetical protein [Erythrobacter sp.]